MTEREYAIVSNLAKLRIAERAIRDCIFIDKAGIFIDKADQEAQLALLNIALPAIQKLEAAVNKMVKG